MHCGFRLPTNHIGPCPNCGKTGTSAVVFGYANISAAVNASASRVFASHNTPVPNEWPEAVSAITTNLIPMLRETLEEHDREVKAKEKSPKNLAIKIAVSIFWILIGGLVGAVLAHMIFH